MNDVLESGGRRISDIYNSCRVRFLALDDEDWFANLNTMADYERFRSTSDA
jgi:molybdopterin-guanine dinucleotide biosynthesis protein A